MMIKKNTYLDGNNVGRILTGGIAARHINCDGLNWLLSIYYSKYHYFFLYL